MAKEALLLYSGGTDSTLAACLLAERFERVRLLTFRRFGLFSVENTARNVAALRRKYGEERFPHEIIGVDRLFKKVSYDRFLSSFLRHGFFLLSTCGLCKLAMHVRAAVYCLDNGIVRVSDGANKGMDLFPDQQPGVIGMLREMYAGLGIEYSNPVFEFEGPPDIGFVDRFHLETLPGLAATRDADFLERKKLTAGHRLFELGLMPSDNVKGTELDRGMQPRCFQFILFNIWLHWYYLPFADKERYVREGDAFFREKIARFSELLAGYKKAGEASELAGYVER